MGIVIIQIILWKWGKFRGVEAKVQRITRTQEYELKTFKSRVGVIQKKQV
jgi:hypothetical protein